MNSQYVLGLPEVDKEHAHLFELAATLYSDDGTAVCEPLHVAAELYGYVYGHLMNEEKLLKDWEHYAEHVAQHRSLMLRLDAIFEKIYNPMFIDPSTFLPELQELIQSWLTVHIKQQDSKYVSYLKAKGY